MKLSTLVLSAILTLGTATAAEARPTYRSWGNVLQHKVRHHRSNRHQHHQNRRQVNHHNRRTHRQARPHRPVHHPAYPYYRRPVRY